MLPIWPWVMATNENRGWAGTTSARRVLLDGERADLRAVAVHDHDPPSARRVNPAIEPAIARAWRALLAVGPGLAGSSEGVAAEPHHYSSRHGLDSLRPSTGRCPGRQTIDDGRRRRPGSSTDSSGLHRDPSGERSTLMTAPDEQELVALRGRWSTGGGPHLSDGDGQRPGATSRPWARWRPSSTTCGPRCTTRPRWLASRRSRTRPRAPGRARAGARRPEHRRSRRRGVRQPRPSSCARRRSASAGWMPSEAAPAGAVWIDVPFRRAFGLLATVPELRIHLPAGRGLRTSLEADVDTGAPRLRDRPGRHRPRHRRAVGGARARRPRPRRRRPGRRGTRRGRWFAGEWDAGSDVEVDARRHP